MYSLIIPVYNNAESLPELVNSLDQISQQLDQPLEVVFVIDGSPDHSYQVLKQILVKISFKAVILVLSRNFGSFSAIRAGLEAAHGPYYAVMAADLQEPPELAVAFFKTLAHHETDIVLGVRAKRNDPPLSQLLAKIYWATYRRFIQKNMPRGGIDVFGCSQMVRDKLLELQESNSSLVGLLMWIGFNRTTLSYERQPRKHGKSAWSFRRKLRYLSNSIFSFSNLPIRILTALGSFSIFLSVCLGIYIAYARLVHHIELPGYASTLLIILFFTGINVLSYGIIGAYVWRIFENSKNRPQSIVMLQHEF